MALYLKQTGDKLTCEEQTDAPQFLSVKIPFSGFYESTHDALLNNWLDYEQEALMSEHDCTLEQVQELSELFYQEINWKAVHTEYAKAYVKEVEKLIADASRKYKEDSTGKRYLSEAFNVSIEFESLESPKYYNYETDCIYGKISTNDIKIMLAELDADEWREFVKERCSHRSGFISFYPSDFDAWDKDISTWGEARLGMVLELYLVTILHGETVSDINEALDAFNLCSDLDGNGYIANWLWENASEKFRTYADGLRKD